MVGPLKNNFFVAPVSETINGQEFSDIQYKTILFPLSKHFQFVKTRWYFINLDPIKKMHNLVLGKAMHRSNF